MSRRKRDSKQLSLTVRRRGRGGARPGAGRPRSRKGVAHDRRERFGSSRALQVTMRVARDVRKLRTRDMYRVIRRVFCETADQGGGFRIVHYSVQDDHLHLVVEAKNRASMTRGMRRVNIRLAKQINRALGRKKGRVLVDRYHEAHLRTPAQVRNSLAYVLNNRRHHVSGAESRMLGRGWIDPCSSAAYFDGWARRDGPQKRPGAGDPVALPRTWMVRIGWQTHGLIASDFVPG